MLRHQLLTLHSLKWIAISSSVISYGRLERYATNGPLGGILLSSITKSHTARGAVGKLIFFLKVVSGNEK